METTNTTTTSTTANSSNNGGTNTNANINTAEPTRAPQPLRRLKEQPQKILDWAFELGDVHCAADAIGLIAQKTGISLCDETVYSKFRKWYKQQKALTESQDLAEQFGGFSASPKRRMNLEAVAETMMMLLMQRSFASEKDGLMMQLLSELRKHQRLLLEQQRYADQKKTKHQEMSDWFQEEVEAVEDEALIDEADRLYRRLYDIVTGNGAFEGEA